MATINGETILPKKRVLKAMMKEGDKEMSVLRQIRQVLEANSGKMSSSEIIRLSRFLKRSAYQNIDIGYIRTILFPERFSYDIPTPLSNIAYSRFTDKQEQILTTGTNAATTSPTGAGLLIWYPHVTMGPSLFFFPQSGTAQGLPYTNPIPLSTGKLDVVKWRAGGYQQYPQYFTQTLLVAASISIQYIGMFEQESGLMCGGSICGQGIDEILIDDIENSSTKAMGRPSTGLRFVYIPKDINDYQYYPAKYETAHNAGAQNQGNETSFLFPVTVAGSNIAFTGLDGQTATYNIPAANAAAIGTAGGITYNNNADYIAIYWRGLPAGADWLRINMVRKFNGIPKNQYRDIMEISKPKRNYDQKKTLDVLNDLSNAIPIAGHMLTDISRVQDQIQAMLPNLGSLHSGGGLSSINSLQGLSTALMNADQTYGEQKIYDYD